MVNTNTSSVAGMVVPVSSPDPKETGIEKQLGLTFPLASVAGTRTVYDFSESMFQKWFPRQRVGGDPTRRRRPGPNVIRSQTVKNMCPPIGKEEEKGMSESNFRFPCQRSANGITTREPKTIVTSDKQSCITIIWYHKIP